MDVAPGGAGLQAEHNLWLLMRAQKTQSTEGDVETMGRCVGFSPREERAQLSPSRVGGMGHPHTGAEGSPGTTSSPKGWMRCSPPAGRCSSPKNTTNQYY